MELSHRETVRPEWVDYNGHMNVAYYVLVFDHGTDAFLDAVGLGEAYRVADDRSIFVVESHVLYQAETHQGDTVTVTPRVLGADQKRIHLFHRMTDGDGNMVATNELMLLHVDLKTRRAAPMPEEAAATVARLLAADTGSPPAEAGRAVALVRR